MQALMRSAGFRSAPKVTCPENWRGQNIRANVFVSIDGADFFVFDMSARPEEPTSSPNVICELGLVHALGLPYVMISNEGSELRFYLRGFRTILLPSENYPDEERLAEHLREDLLALLEPTNKYDYAANPISDH
ncbi:hypothetical protein QTI24_24505 [Variovorax sp. J22P240]|uniref:hypothetical protein n=1 Tax=Variovorax sp. J22P240 TaxID=3053514 RepID=UPI0025779BDC|nr:hypothetical protein [Variovorax sp. J22P240]MDM0001792.1 hypothetical protein [Variovorax sp. J22P240]